jgi:hypothetical protein
MTPPPGERTRTVLVDRLEWDAAPTQKALRAQWQATGWEVTAVFVRPIYEITLTQTTPKED